MSAFVPEPIKQEPTKQELTKLNRFLRSLALILVDVFLATLAMMEAVRLRYDFLNVPVIGDIDERAGWLTAYVTLIVWIFMRQDRLIWRFTTLHDLRRLFLGVAIVFSIVSLILFFFFDRGEFFPRTAVFFAALLFAALILVTRFAAMMVQNGDFRSLFRFRGAAESSALLIGPAPDLHAYLRMRMRDQGGLNFNPVGLIETTGVYRGRQIQSVPVLGGIDDLRKIYGKITRRQNKSVQLISVNSSPTRAETGELLQIASELGAPLGREASGASEGLSPFEAADLIGRDMRVLDIEPVRNMFHGKHVLVTGAGGSIGSELSQQIAAFHPAKLSLVDSSEFHLYKLEKRLAALDGMGGRCWQTFIGDIRNISRLREIFTSQRPDIVLHAAALKHVPLGERNPLEVLRTNVAGSCNLLDVCEEFSVQNFILISTDKAVSPTNIMGASKRIVEMLTLARQAQSKTMQAAVVRFGNVLASNGSVVNLFEEQIATGGPVTVTHPDVNRYFMMIEEAAALVLQASTLGARRRETIKEGDHDVSASIYVLEMGEPVNIARLARQLIRLRGKVPDVDVEVKFTGLRPGEKISEVLSYENEDLARTAVDGVLRFAGVIEGSDLVLSQVETLIKALEICDREGVVKAVQALVPGYDSSAIILKSNSDPS